MMKNNLFGIGFFALLVLAGFATAVDEAHCWNLLSFDASARVAPMATYPYTSYSDLYQVGQTSFFIQENSGLAVSEIARYSALCLNGIQGDYPPYTIAYIDTNIDDDRESGSTVPFSGISQINLGNNNPVQDSHFFCDGSNLWIGLPNFTTQAVPFSYGPQAVRIRLSQNNVVWKNLNESFAVNVLKNDSFFKSKDLLLFDTSTTLQSVKTMQTNQRLRVNIPVQNTGTTYWLADGGTPSNAVYYLSIRNPQNNGGDLTAPFIINPLTYTLDHPSLVPISFASYQTVNNATLGHPVYNSVVKPGEVALFSFDLTAPSTPGTYSLNLQMAQYGFQAFGEAITTTIQVVPATHDASCQVDIVGQSDEAGKSVSSGTLSQLTIGKKYTIRIDFTNQGNQSWTLDQTEQLGVGFVSLNGTHDSQFTNQPATIPIDPQELSTPNQSGIAEFHDLELTPTSEGVADFSFQANSAFFNGNFGQNCRIQVPIGKRYDASGTLEIKRVRDGNVMGLSENLVVGEDYAFILRVKNEGSPWTATNPTAQTGLWNGSGSFNGYISLKDGNRDYQPPLGEFYKPLGANRFALLTPNTLVATSETRQSQSIMRTPQKAGTIRETFRMTEDDLAPTETNPARYGEFGQSIVRQVTIVDAPIVPRCSIDQSEALQGEDASYTVRYYDINGAAPTPTINASSCPAGATLKPGSISCVPASSYCRYECEDHALTGTSRITVSLASGGVNINCSKNIAVVTDLTAPIPDLNR